jgi:hypothetical protein
MLRSYESGGGGPTGSAIDEMDHLSKCYIVYKM